MINSSNRSNHGTRLFSIEFFPLIPRVHQSSCPILGSSEEPEFATFGYVIQSIGFKVWQVYCQNAQSQPNTSCAKSFE